MNTLLRSYTILQRALEKTYFWNALYKTNLIENVGGELRQCYKFEFAVSENVRSKESGHYLGAYDIALANAQAESPTKSNVQTVTKARSHEKRRKEKKKKRKRPVAILRAPLSYT